MEQFSQLPTFVQLVLLFVGLGYFIYRIAIYYEALVRWISFGDFQSAISTIPASYIWTFALCGLCTNIAGYVLAEGTSEAVSVSKRFLLDLILFGIIIAMRPVKKHRSGAAA